MHAAGAGGSQHHADGRPWTKGPGVAHAGLDGTGASFSGGRCASHAPRALVLLVRDAQAQSDAQGAVMALTLDASRPG